MLMIDVDQLVDVTDTGRELNVSIEFRNLKLFLDALYDELVDAVGYFNDLSISRLFLPMPSGLAFVFAVRDNGVWQVEDFRLDEAPVVKTKLRLPGIEFHFPGLPTFNFDWLRFLMDIFTFGLPEIQNKELTTKNHWWFIQNELIRAEVVGRKYSVRSLAIDISTLALLYAIVTLFKEHGLGDIVQNAFSKMKTTDVVQLSKTVANITKAANNTDQILTNVGLVKDDTAQNVVQLSEGANTVKSNVLDVVETASSISANTTSIINQITELGSSLDLTTILSKLDELKSLMGLRFALR